MGRWLVGFGLLVCFVGLAFRLLRGVGVCWIAGWYLSCNAGFDLLFVVCRVAADCLGFFGCDWV